jgi:hypothetical protein
MSKATISVEFAQAGALVIGGVTLKGGQNQVDLEAWLKVAKMPALKALIDQGLVKPGPLPEPPKPQGKAKPPIED